jgi:hypothetical protein
MLRKVDGTVLLYDLRASLYMYASELGFACLRMTEHGGIKVDLTNSDQLQYEADTWVRSLRAPSGSIHKRFLQEISEAPRRGIYFSKEPKRPSLVLLS